MSIFPVQIENKIRSLNIHDTILIFFLLDPKGIILEFGGQFEALRIERPEKGNNIQDTVIFMEGLLPLEQSSLELFFIKIHPEISVDAHLYKTEQGYALLILDATTQEKEQRKTQQVYNVKHLNQRLQR